MFELTVLVQGYPGKAVCHGGLGWSTIALLQSADRKILIDVGAFGIRKPLKRQLDERGIKPTDITDVVLTHAHYDHAINFTLFENATVWIGKDELEWAVSQKPGFNPLPELYVRELSVASRVRRITDGEEFIPGIKAMQAPGHTPGSMVFYLTDSVVPVVFTGDAAKNRAEILSRSADATEDKNTSRQSIEMIWQLWRSKPGTILVPGHDLTMRLNDQGEPEYLGTRHASIAAWFGDDLEQIYEFNLAGVKK